RYSCSWQQYCWWGRGNEQHSWHSWLNGSRRRRREWGWKHNGSRRRRWECSWITRQCTTVELACKIYFSGLHPPCPVCKSSRGVK
ncbi:unnamed protein product, partial [Ascophyllum nodosum]